MASRGLTLRVRTAWWLPLYIHTIKWFYVLTGQEPDWDKVGRVVVKGMKLKTGEPSRLARRISGSASSYAVARSFGVSVWKANYLRVRYLLTGRSGRYLLPPRSDWSA